MKLNIEYNFNTKFYYTIFAYMSFVYEIRIKVLFCIVYINKKNFKSNSKLQYSLLNYHLNI